MRPPARTTGLLTVAALGKTVPVPVMVKVLPWTLPDSQDFRTWIDAFESPDTLSVEYGVPLWSDQHFAMIAESFSLIRETGSRVLYIPAISHTNLGNEESMIRWIRKPGRGFDWTSPSWTSTSIPRWQNSASRRSSASRSGKFTCGPPRRSGLRISASSERRRPPSLTGHKEDGERHAACALRSVEQGDMAGVDREGQEHLKQRGIEKAMMLGMFCDIGPSKEDADFFFSIAPDLEWVQQGHGFWTKVGPRTSGTTRVSGAGSVLPTDAGRRTRTGRRRPMPCTAGAARR